MKGERAVFTRQVEGGDWQAYYEGGEPNQFGKGATKEEAVKNLQQQTLQGLAAGDRVATGAVSNVKVDRVIVKKLPHPVEKDGKVVSHVAYRESNPAVQGYGPDENSARVQFLSIK